jgi:hypothetical protein
VNADQTLLGYVDETGPKVSGWAVDMENPEKPCPLDLFFDGVFVATFWTGGVRRPDVKNAHPRLSGENYGFSLDIGTWLKPIEQSIEIRFNRSGRVIPNGLFSAQALPCGVNLVHGNNGYIFYRGDSNDTLMQLSRPCARLQEAVDEICKALAATQAVCRNFGAEYGAMIVPDRAAAIPDEVGNSFELSPKRPASRLIERARSHYGSEILYPLDRIAKLPSAQRASLYDTHLSIYATYQAFLVLAGRYFRERHQKFDSRISWVEEAFQGDIVSIGGLDASETRLAPCFEAPAVELFDTLRLYPHAHYSGSTRAYFNESVETGVALIFGTSSSKLMLPFFSNSFRMVGHVWSNAVDYELISNLRPTHVFSLLTEKTVGTLSIPDKGVEDADRLLAARETHMRRLPNRRKRNSGGSRAD